MRLLWLSAVVLAWLGLVPSALCREWTDSSGKHRIEAKLVVVKEGKAYLEKSNGAVISLGLDRLSTQDQEYLQSLPECRDYFQKNPPPGPKPSPKPTPPPAARPMATIRVDDASKVGEIRRFSNLGWGVKSLAFSPDGALLAVGKMDQALAVYDLDKTTRTSFHERLEGLGQVECVAFTPDGKKLLSGGYTGRIQVWNVGPGGALTEANRFVGHARAIHTITIASDGKTVLSGGQEKKLRCWDLESGRERFAVEGFQGNLKASFISRLGKQGLGCDGETLALIDMQEGKIIQRMTLAGHYARAVAIAPDGWCVAVQDTYALRLWEIRSGHAYAPLQDQEIPWTACFLPDSRHLLSGGRGKVTLWDVATQRRLYEFDIAGSLHVQTLACSPDNRHFAAISSAAGQEVQVFRLPAETARPTRSD